MLKKNEEERKPFDERAEENKDEFKEIVKDFEKKVEKEPEPKIKPRIIEKPGSLVDKPKSLVEQVQELTEIMKNVAQMDAKKLKKKTFKMPLKVKSTTRNLTKMMQKNKVQVLMLKITGAIQPTTGEINTGRLIVGDKYWNAADDIIWSWLNKIPTAIICEWDMQPLTKSRLMQDTNSLKTWLHPQTIIIRAIEAKEAIEKASGPKIKPIMFIVIGVVVLVAWYLFFGG